MLLARSPSIGENFGNTLVIAGRCHQYPPGRKQATTKAAEKLIFGTEEFISLRDSSRVSFFVKISMFFILKDLMSRQDWRGINTG